MKEDKQRELDQFITRPEVAEECWNRTKDFLNSVANVEDYFWIEPSAGHCSLYKHLPEGQRQAYDLDPYVLEHEPTAIVGDFLKQDVSALDTKGKELAVFGNFPFGKRAKLVVEFFNYLAPNVAFMSLINPCTAEKHSVQKQLAMGWHLVQNTRLREDAFLYKGKPYRVRCSHQLWCNTETFLKWGGVLDEGH